MAGGQTFAGAKPWVAEVQPYQPGKPIEEVQRELGIPRVTKLASNENAFGPSPRALQALQQSAAHVHRYPDGACFALRRKLAAKLKVEEAQLVFGAGSDELLELLAKSLLGPGDEFVYPWPSFPMYPIVAQGFGAVPAPVALTNNFEHDLPAMAARVTKNTRLLAVCNPNNPTGAGVGAAALEEFLTKLPAELVLVLDEAYVEYARRPDFPDALAILRRRPATVVLRTFSKIYGLAGLRIGYGICGAALAGLLERARHPFNVNAPAVVAAEAALADEAHVQRSREGNARGINYLQKELQALGIRTWPTEANFVLAQSGAGSADALLRRGVIVRGLAGFGLPEHVRITVGTPEENERLITALAQVQKARAK